MVKVGDFGLARDVPKELTRSIDGLEREIAEFIGTAFLLGGVIGSGIMAERLSTDVGLQLLQNALATGGALLALITFALSAMAAMFGVLQPVLVWVAARAMPLAAGDASLSALLHWPLWVLPPGLGVACFAGVRMCIPGALKV